MKLVLCKECYQVHRIPSMQIWRVCNECFRTHYRFYNGKVWLQGNIKVIVISDADMKKLKTGNVEQVRMKLLKEPNDFIIRSKKVMIRKPYQSTMEWG